MSATKKWGDPEKQHWLKQQSIKRSYADEVIRKIDRLKKHFDCQQYGALSIDSDRYPLFLLRTRNWQSHLPNVLITGGVHGYETSGVQGALRFLQTTVEDYAHQYNFVVAPCVSPWGYETINRWNPKTLDPNRSFFADSGAEESLDLMKVVQGLDLEFIAHFDLHETTDTDNTVFLPAKAERDASELVIWEIPDGFYVVGDSENPQLEFQQAIIESVKKVTHIAPADDHNKIIGEPILDEGIIVYECEKLSLCTGFTKSQYPATTEVYPDSPKVDDEECILAQVAAVKGGLDFLNQSGKNQS